AGGVRSHRGEGGQVAGEVRVHRVCLVQRQVHVVLGAGALAGLGDGDLVWTAHAQATRDVAAAGIGGGGADRARLHVGDHDLGAGHRLTAAGGHVAADARGGALVGGVVRGEHGQ